MPRRIPRYLFRSVRGRLVLLVAALVLPVMALACAMIFQAYRNERAAVANNLLATARAVSGVVDGEVDEANALLKAFAASGAVARDDLGTVDAMARRALATDERSLIVTDPQGQQRVNTRVPENAPLPRITFDPELLAALYRGDYHVSNLQESVAAHVLVLQVSRPYFRDGELKYILTISIPPSWLARAIDVDRYAPGNIVTIVDRRGSILARSLNSDRYLGKSAASDIVHAITNTEGIVDSTTLEGIPVVTAFSRAKCGWSTVIGAPKKELYVSARRLLALGIVGSTLLMLVAIVMAAWIGRALVRSVDALATDAEAIARSDMPGAKSSGLGEIDFVADAMRRTGSALLRRTRTLEVLNRINATLVAERDLKNIVQNVTDAGRELSRAEFGAFYYTVQNERGETYLLHTLSGAQRPTLARSEPSRSTPAFQPTLTGLGVVRVADLASSDQPSVPQVNGDARRDGPIMRSYLAVPVKSRTGDVIGGLFFSHSQPGVFTQEAEDIVVGLAAEAAIAMDNAKLYHALARELEAKSRAEAELRKAQERLHEHARELELKVEERTASLQEAVTQMEEFSYTVSHDLRSPLRTMQGFADALMEDYSSQLDETARDYLRRIQRASRRMDQLTTDLLSYSRIVRAQVQLEPTDVEKIVRGTIEHYAELQPPNATVVIESPLTPVLAHEPSLTQCLANLLTNAAKFVKPGEKPHVTIRTERREGRVRIWVEDRGIGIPPQFRSGIFRIFERGPNSSRYEGTGVGLAIVRKAAEKMGGSCGVESDGASGSRFWIDLAAA